MANPHAPTFKAKDSDFGPQPGEGGVGDGMFFAKRKKSPNGMFYSAEGAEKSTAGQDTDAEAGKVDHALDKLTDLHKEAYADILKEATFSSAAKAGTVGAMVGAAAGFAGAKRLAEETPASKAVTRAKVKAAVKKVQASEAGQAVSSARETLEHAGRAGADAAGAVKREFDKHAGIKSLLGIQGPEKGLDGRALPTGLIQEGGSSTGNATYRAKQLDYDSPKELAAIGKKPTGGVYVKRWGNPVKPAKKKPALMSHDPRYRENNSPVLQKAAPAPAKGPLIKVKQETFKPMAKASSDAEFDELEKSANFLALPTKAAVGKAVLKGLGYGGLGVGALGVGAGAAPGGSFKSPLVDMQTGDIDASQHPTLQKVKNAISPTEGRGPDYGGQAEQIERLGKATRARPQRLRDAKSDAGMGETFEFMGAPETKLQANRLGPATSPLAGLAERRAASDAAAAKASESGVADLPGPEFGGFVPAKKKEIRKDLKVQGPSPKRMAEGRAMAEGLMGAFDEAPAGKAPPEQQAEQAAMAALKGKSGDDWQGAPMPTPAETRAQVAREQSDAWYGAEADKAMAAPDPGFAGVDYDDTGPGTSAVSYDDVPDPVDTAFIDQGQAPYLPYERSTPPGPGESSKAEMQAALAKAPPRPPVEGSGPSGPAEQVAKTKAPPPAKKQPAKAPPSRTGTPTPEPAATSASGRREDPSLTADRSQQRSRGTNVAETGRGPKAKTPGAQYAQRNNLPLTRAEQAELAAGPGPEAPIAGPAAMVSAAPGNIGGKGALDEQGLAAMVDKEEGDREIAGGPAPYVAGRRESPTGALGPSYGADITREDPSLTADRSQQRSRGPNVAETARGPKAKSPGAQYAQKAGLPLTRAEQAEMAAGPGPEAPLASPSRELADARERSGAPGGIGDKAPTDMIALEIDRKYPDASPELKAKLLAQALAQGGLPAGG